MAVTASASAAPVTGEELRAEVVYGCYVQSGEFGAEAVDVCVRDEFAAAASRGRTVRAAARRHAAPLTTRTETALP